MVYRLTNNTLDNAGFFQVKFLVIKYLVTPANLKTHNIYLKIHQLQIDPQ